MKLRRRAFLKAAAFSAVLPSVSRANSLVASFAGQAAGPTVHFPTAPRDRVAVASYPFRGFIAGARDPQPTSSKMPIKEFAAHVKQKFNLTHIEPWSEHFVSTEAAYLDELKEAVRKVGCGIANIAADGEDSFYSKDALVRARAVAFGKKWIDVAAHIGSPSVRINMPSEKDTKPDAALVAESLRVLAA